MAQLHAIHVLVRTPQERVRVTAVNWIHADPDASIDAKLPAAKFSQRAANGDSSASAVPHGVLRNIASAIGYVCVLVMSFESEPLCNLILHATSGAQERVDSRAAGWELAATRCIENLDRAFDKNPHTPDCQRIEPGADSECCTGSGA